MASGAPMRLFSRDFLLICLADFFFFSCLHLFMSTLPVYVVSLGIPEGQLGFILGVFTFTAVVTRLLVGREADRRGRRAFLLSGPIIFTLSSLLYSGATSFWTLSAVRLLHGSGIAAFTVPSMALIADLAPPARRGEALGYFSVAGGLTMLFAPAAGMAIYYAWGFVVHFVVGAALAVAAFLAIAPVAMSPAADKPQAMTASATSAIMFSRGAAYPALLIASLTITYGSVTSFLPLYALGRGMSNPGLYFTAYAVCLVLARFTAGSISDRIGRFKVIAPCMLLTAAATAALIGAESTPVFLALGALYGLGFGACYPPLIAMAVDRVPPTERGAAMGTFTAAFDLGIGVGSVLWGFVLQYGGFGLLYATAGLLPIAGLLTMPFDYRRRIRTTP